MTKMARVFISGDAKVSDSRTSAIIWEDFIVEYKDGNKFERKRKWTIWFNSPISAFDSGDWVELSGELGTKLETYEKDGETKTAVSHAINNPEVIQVKLKEVPKVAKPRDPDDEAKYAPF